MRKEQLTNTRESKHQQMLRKEKEAQRQADLQCKQQLQRGKMVQSTNQPPLEEEEEEEIYLSEEKDKFNTRGKKREEKVALMNQNLETEGAT